MTTDRAHNVTRVVAGTVEEIPPGGRKLIVPFRGRAGIGVFNVNGAYYALRNICPHKQGPLCTGYIHGRRGPAVGSCPGCADYAIERDGEIIRCPWHLWEFDLTTRQCLIAPNARVKTYPVVIEGTHVVVYADAADLPIQQPDAARAT